MPQPRYQAPPAGGNRTRVGIAVLLVLTVGAVFGQTVGFGFTNYDDPEYVAANPHVLGGLTWDSVLWAFTTTAQANWHPLTWISLMADVEIHGRNPGAMHLTNVILHAIATVLLFLALDAMTRARGRSAFVAALFAVHPLRVESVAWIAERKDLLCGVFWMAALLAWVAWARSPSRPRRVLVASCMAMGALAKPMIVTLPAALLLLDYWPLGRLRPGTWVRRVTEKADLWAIAAFSSTATVVAQTSGGAVGSLDLFPWTARVANALVSYLVYLAQAVWPRGLAAIYPHPGAAASTWVAWLAAAVLACVSILAWVLRHRLPWLAVGWAWYVGTLVPVIGIIQVGLQSRADRYTYLPLVGIFVVVVWGVHALAAGWLERPVGRRVGATVVAGAIVAGYGVVAWHQVRFWRDGVMLFERAVAVTGANAVARNNLGSAYYRRGQPGDLQRSVEHYSEAVRISPTYAVAFNNLAGALLQLQRADEAEAAWRRALALRPGYTAAACNLAGVLLKSERLDEAMEWCRQALRADPDAGCAHYNLGMAFLRMGRLDAAGEHLAASVRSEPDYPDARVNWGVVLARQGRITEAIEQFRVALDLDPGHTGARHNLERAEARSRGGS
jgi:Tfp pilus assembly protein PilF